MRVSIEAVKGLGHVTNGDTQVGWWAVEDDPVVGHGGGVVDPKVDHVGAAQIEDVNVEGRADGPEAYQEVHQDGVENHGQQLGHQVKGGSHRDHRW